MKDDIKMGPKQTEWKGADCVYLIRDTSGRFLFLFVVHLATVTVDQIIYRRTMECLVINE
jgi:hypothetical protein